MMRWSELFPSHSSAIFVILLLSLLFGWIHIFYIIMWCDTRSFTHKCKNWYDRGFRLRFFFRGAHILSRMVWLSYFWIFIGTAPFFILCLIMLLNHCYLFARGYLTESFHVITKFFVIPDLSVGVGNYNSNNRIDIDLISRILYATTHCAICVVFGFADDPLVIDLLQWLHWFEDLILWAIITGICNQQPDVDADTTLLITNGQDQLWDVIWTKPRFEAFYALAIISWFFSGGHYCVLREDNFVDKKQKPMKLTQGILGLAESGQWRALEKLLERMRSTGINRKNHLDGGKTALHYAIEQHKWDVVEKLLSLGADPTVMDRQHRSAIQMVLENDRIKDMHLYGKFLDAIPGDGQSQRDNKGRSLLHVICRNDTVAIPLRNRLGGYIARFSDRDEHPSFDVNMADHDGCSAMHYIVQQSTDREAIAYLVEKGGDIEGEDNQKRTPLQYAVQQHDNVPAVRWLLENGANINHQDDKGWTPLHYAVSSNVYDNLEVLVENIPIVTIRNNAGKNAFNLAIAKGHTRCADFLRWNTPLEEQVEMDAQEMQRQKQKKTKMMEKVTSSSDQETETGGNPLLSTESDPDRLIVEESQEVNKSNDVVLQVDTLDVGAVEEEKVKEAGDGDGDGDEDINEGGRQFPRTIQKLMDLTQSPSTNEETPDEATGLKVADTLPEPQGYLAIDNSRTATEDPKETTPAQNENAGSMNYED